jgi:hypothetical protein
MNAVVEATPIAQTAAANHAVSVITPNQMLQLAVERNASIEQMERLYALKVQFEADEAKKAFNAAFAQFKAAAVQVIKTKKITDGPLKGKMHADLWDVVMAATKPLAEFGLSTAWTITKDEKDWIEVTCTLKHERGHSESVGLGGAPDTGPGRNAIQARGSTITYLQRYTLTAILGLAAREQDDDGAGGAGEEGQQQGADDPVLKRGRDASMNGMVALTEWWGSLTGKERSTYNAEFKTMRRAAQEADRRGGGAQ